MWTEPLVIVAIVCFLIVQAAVVSLVVYLWRNDGLVSPTTSLYMGLLVFWGPALPLLVGSLSGKTLFAASALPATTVAATFFALSLMIICLISGTLLHRLLLVGPAPLLTPAHTAASPVFLIAMAYCIGWVFLMLIVPETRGYITDIARFFVQPDAAEYQRIRRVDYTESTIIAAFIGRARYTANALFFSLLIIAAAGLVRPRMIIFVIAMPFAFFLIANISKLTYVYYIMYGLMTTLAIRRDLFVNWTNQLRFIAIATIAFLLSTLLLYSLQYEGIEAQTVGLWDLIELAIYRVFVANYDGLLAYIYVYPQMLPHVGFPSLTMISALFGFEAIDHSVAIVRVVAPENYGYTTYPTIFIGAAYADQGWIGIALFSTFVGFYVSWVRSFLGRLGNALIGQAALVVVTLNTQFFLAVPAMTTLITYGLLTVPLLAKVLDLGLALLADPARASGPEVARHDPQVSR